VIDLLPQSAIIALQSSISEKRFRHCLGVLEASFRLADAWEHYDIDRRLLAWAALFHDCAKELTKSKQIRLVNNGNLIYGRELIHTSKLSHAPLGALLLQTKYGMDHPEVLMAVAYHPTGHSDLTPIGWIVYMADYLEPGRAYVENRDEILDAACNDPLTGLRMVTDLRISMVLKKGKDVHPMAEQFKTHLEQMTMLCEERL
jgi:predicted HD superfamily hydrolase involved in NAD metabolism